LTNHAYSGKHYEMRNLPEEHIGLNNLLKHP
jgi:hypothetical protein